MNIIRPSVNVFDSIVGIFGYPVALCLTRWLFHVQDAIPMSMIFSIFGGMVLYNYGLHYGYHLAKKDHGLITARRYEEGRR